MLHLVHSSSEASQTPEPISAPELKERLTLRIIIEHTKIIDVVIGRPSLPLMDIHIPWGVLVAISDELDRARCFQSVQFGSRKTICHVRDCELSFEIRDHTNHKEESVVFINQGAIGGNTICLTASAWAKIHEMVWCEVDNSLGWNIAISTNDPNSILSKIFCPRSGL
jgi:hypothetical protein